MKFVLGLIKFGVVLLFLFTASACSLPSTPNSTPALPPVIDQTADTGTDSSAQPEIAADEPFDVPVELFGEPEVVFNWSEDRCAGNQFADLPARAIRTSDGNVELFISHEYTYRMVGPDFNSLVPDCSGPVLVSDYDRNPANYSYLEWLAAPYTLDGETIYAIVHQEFHGDMAGSIWQADGEFGPDGTSPNWSYFSWTGSTLIPMTNFDPEKNVWWGNGNFCLIGPSAVHPAIGCDPDRVWTSPVDGTVTVNSRVYDLDPNGGNGVEVKILHNDTEIWSATIENGDTTGAYFELAVDVVEGDQIHFRVNARGDTDNDTTYFNPGINLGPAPCPSGRHDMCTLISLTSAVSTDGGATFTQPDVPDHLLATMPYQYDPDWMRSIWQPSNIVQNPNDGYYYALIQFDEHSQDYSINIQGMCLMRTDALADPKSWRAWDGAGFNVSFINPYVETDANPEAHRCVLVTPSIGALTYGLSYNTYLEKFIAVGVGADGIYFSFSDDLIDWTPRKFIMPAEQVFSPNPEPPFLVYPTLIDHDSESLSFDTTGQYPYLYFTRMNDIGENFNTDILRIQLKLGGD